MKKTPAIQWHVESIDESSVILRADPMPRVIPDGLRVRVTAQNTESKPAWNREPEPMRAAAVAIVDADGVRNREDGVRFGSTLANGFCSATIEESSRWHDDSSSLEWSPRWDSVLAWRHGGADDLPDGARDAMRTAFTLAASFVGLHLPHLWQGAALASARYAVEDAERESDRARAALKTARAALRKAEREHARAVPVAAGADAGVVR